MKTSGNKKKLLLAALLTTGITMGLAHTGIAANTTVTQPACSAGRHLELSLAGQ